MLSPARPLLWPLALLWLVGLVWPAHPLAMGGALVVTVLVSIVGVVDWITWKARVGKEVTE